MAVSCHSCGNRPFCVVAQLEKNGLDSFSASLTRYSVEGKERAIFNQGEPFNSCYFLCGGIAKLVRLLPGGEAVILEVVIPFSVLGACPNDQSPTHSYSVLTVSKSTEIGYINNEKLLALINTYPDLGIAFSRHLAKRLEKAYGMVSSLKRRVSERILLAFGRALPYSKEEDQPGWKRIALSHTELAQLVQSTPETVSRLLHRFCDEELVRLGKRGEIFLSAAKLEEMLRSE